MCVRPPSRLGAASFRTFALCWFTAQVTSSGTLSGATAALRSGLRDSDTFGSVITKDHLIAFAAGAIIAALATWFIRQPKDNSERLRKLERDSMDYVQDKEEQAKKYTRIDSAYRYDMAMLSWRLDSVTHARSHRPPSRILDSDSLARAIEAEVGIVRHRDGQSHP